MTQNFDATNKIIKLLLLSTSSNKNEALLALNKAKTLTNKHFTGDVLKHYLSKIEENMYKIEHDIPVSKEESYYRYKMNNFSNDYEQDWYIHEHYSDFVRETQKDFAHNHIDFEPFSRNDTHSHSKSYCYTTPPERSEPTCKQTVKLISKILFWFGILLMGLTTILTFVSQNIAYLLIGGLVFLWNTTLAYILANDT